MKFEATELILNKFFISLCSIYSVLSQSSLSGQVADNGIMPAEVAPGTCGWATTLQNGNLTFGMPISTVPGEVPIPVGFGFDAACLAMSWEHPEFDPDRRAPRIVTYRMDWPIAAGIHFGYLTENRFGDTPLSSMPETPSSPGMVVLESGKQIPDSRCTPISFNSVLGTNQNMPQAFGFDAGIIHSARTDPTATYLLFSTTGADLPAPFQCLMPDVAPSGFGGQGGHQGTYRIVMDRRLTRVYAYATDAKAWLPVLWADPFGHCVTFKWERSTTHVPAGLRSITKVTALNRWSQGVVVRWAEPVSNTTLSDTCRVDFLGVQAPSALIQGYGGSPSCGPEGFSLQAHDHHYIVSQTNLGIAGRPTTLAIGARGYLPQPTWADSGSAAAATPSSLPGDGVQDPPCRTWRFTYDHNLAELKSIADPKGVVTSFGYSTYHIASTNHVRGVSEVHVIDAARNKRYMRWTRTFPSGSAPMSIKVEGWGDPDKETPDRFHQITLATDALNFGNGAPQQDVLMDDSGKAWSSTNYSWLPEGSGLDGTLSRAHSLTVRSEGAPTLTTTFSYSDPARLQSTRIATSVEDANGIPLMVSLESSASIATPWDRFDGRLRALGDPVNFAPTGFWVYQVVCRGQVTMSTTNEVEALSELERRREHGTERGGTGVKCEIVRNWVSGVGPMGNPGDRRDRGQIPGSGNWEANQLTIKDLAMANDAGKHSADCSALNVYLRSIGAAVIFGAAGGATTGGEVLGTLGTLFGGPVGTLPALGTGALGGAVIGGFAGLVPTSITGGIALREAFQKNEDNWKANYRAIQNYSDTNCDGAKPEIRY